MKPHRSGVAQRAPTPDKPHEITHDRGRVWDQVDESGWESFPASDPPARWAGQDKTELPPMTNGEAERPEAEDEDDG